MTSKSPLWNPSTEAIANHPLTLFTMQAEERAERVLLPGYTALHAWSIEDRAGFWDLVGDFCGVIGTKGERRLVNGDRMPGAQFFPDAELNFAENLLRRNDASEALIFWGEDRVKRRLTWRELGDLVSRLQQAFRGLGIGKG